MEWRQRCLSYAVSERQNADSNANRVREAVASSFRTWTQVTCDEERTGIQVHEIAEPVDCMEPEYNKRGPNVNSVLFVTDWEARQNDRHAFALTSVWHNPDTGEILDGDIELNDTEMGELGEFGVCPVVRPCEPGVVDIQNVVTHEVGHFFGLGHSAVRGSTMFPTSPPGEVTKRTLASDDREGFCAIYPPGSLSQRCDFTPRGGLSLQCWDPNGCACTTPGRLSMRDERGLWLAAVGVLGLLWSWRRRARRR